MCSSGGRRVPLVFCLSVASHARINCDFVEHVTSLGIIEDIFLCDFLVYRIYTGNVPTSESSQIL